MGRQTEKSFTDILSLTILCDSAMHMVSMILVHPIMVDSKEHVVGSLEAEFQEFSPSH